RPPAPPPFAYTTLFRSFAAGEHRLEDAGRVDGTFGSTGTDERVDLVDEHDDVAAGADLLEHLLQALFEVTAVAAAGDKRTEVKRDRKSTRLNSSHDQNS